MIVILFIICASVLFQVREVTIEGNTYHTKEEVEQMFFGKALDKNAITFFLREFMGIKKELPFVREYDVSYIGIGKVGIKIYEKTIVAGVQYMNEFIYFDKEGLVLESTHEKKVDIPIFNVAGLTDFTLYSKVQINNEAALDRMLKISDLLIHYNLKAERILFDSQNEPIMYSGDIKILMGKQEDYDNAMQALQSVIMTARRKNIAGEIDLTNYKVGDNIIIKMK
jgi:cell division protein FtsQ